MDYVYPKSEPEPEPYDELDASVEAQNIIDICENGVTDYKGFEDGEKVGRVHVCAIVNQGHNYDFAELLSLYDEIDAERTRCEGIHFCDYDTLSAFKAALAEQMTYLDVDTWISELNKKHQFSTWAEAQAWCDANYNQEP